MNYFTKSKSKIFFKKSILVILMVKLIGAGKGNELEKFIRAFSKPYKGAFTFLENSNKKNIY